MTSTARWATRRPWLSAGAGAGILALAIGGWALWPSPEPAAAPRARVYRDVDVCLLTDAQGITAGQARQAWQGLQGYSTATAVRVSYIPVIGPTTPENAATFLAGLVQRHCQVIIAVGAAQIAAVEQASTRSPDTGFVVVGTTRQDRANVVAVSPAEPRLGDAVSSAVTHLATP